MLELILCHVSVRGGKRPVSALRHIYVSDNVACILPPLCASQGSPGDINSSYTQLILCTIVISHSKVSIFELLDPPNCTISIWKNFLLTGSAPSPAWSNGAHLKPYCRPFGPHHITPKVTLVTGTAVQQRIQYNSLYYHSNYRLTSDPSWTESIARTYQFHGSRHLQATAADASLNERTFRNSVPVVWNSLPQHQWLVILL